MSSNGTVDRTNTHCILGRIPNRKPKATTWLQDSEGFAHSIIWVSEVTHPETAHYCVEALRGKGQRIGIRLFESNRRVSIPRHVQL